MRYRLFFLIAVLICGFNTLQGQTKEVRPVKNVILMIPDGTSIGVVSAARWYKKYNKLGDKLNIDPYMCGTVLTFSSNAPIGDSAPTTSCYMTGMPQQSGNVAIYPLADPENDLVSVDPQMAYQPLATILEAAKMEQKKATGLVVTVEFPHATPADCSSHYYNRNAYKYIAPQMAYNNLDVMFGGGTSILTDDIRGHFQGNNTRLIEDNVADFRKLSQANKTWALFCKKEHPYDLDRDPKKTPSLDEMTQKAIELLSKNENGFFLMVEGSKIDWAAHGNDAAACITEYLAFDKAVGTAIDFAKKNGETAVIILPDHGNSGFTIGRKDLKNYTKASIEQLFGNVSKYKKTAEGLEAILLKEQPDKFKSLMKQYTDIDITDKECESLIKASKKTHDDYTEVGNTPNMVSTLVKIMNARTSFGFTSNGHTGEEVFLAAYHPQGDVPMGVKSNVEINQYLSDVLGLKKPLTTLTQEIFAKHTDVFAGMDYEIDKSTEFPMLRVKFQGKVLEIPSFKSIALVDQKPFDLGSVTVYIDKNETFYLPKNILEKLK